MDSPNKMAKGSQNEFEKDIRSHFEERQKSLNILATTTSPTGQVIDWIPIESQGKIAATPPAPVVQVDGIAVAVAELDSEGAQKGPEGTVPILRKNLDAIEFKEPLSKYLNKIRGARPGLDKDALLPQAGGVHRYGSSQQSVTCYGGKGNLSYWNPIPQFNDDFSLLQTGMINTAQGYDQTVEAGWQAFQLLNGDTASHLFTYYTTNGYASSGNNVGGYNRDVAGWVQVSTSVFPGTVFSPYSVQGGNQTLIPIQYQLYQGNWWLGVNGAWIGYYPASLFSKNGSLNNTLGNNANVIGWWGEVFDDQTEAGGRTTTDMGSGQFPSTGWQHSAYMNNLQYQSDAAGTLVDYNGSNAIVQEDPDMYQIGPNFNSGTTWGSYAWVGGPGAG